MGDCRSPAWALPYYSGGTALGCPFRFQHRDHWAAAPTWTTAAWFPWWHGTSHLHTEGGDVAGSSRLDMVILAGRGWADDDPVRPLGHPAADGHLRDRLDREPRGAPLLQVLRPARRTARGSDHREQQVEFVV